jgi:hypothetical protein
MSGKIPAGRSIGRGDLVPFAIPSLMVAGHNDSGGGQGADKYSSFPAVEMRLDSILADNQWHRIGRKAGECSAEPSRLPSCPPSGKGASLSHLITACGIEFPGLRINVRPRLPDELFLRFGICGLAPCHVQPPPRP